jgi:hypothetical protein
MVPGYRVQRYRPKVKKGFSLIQCCQNATDPTDVHWRLTSPDNVLSIYGKTRDSRIFNPDAPDQTFEWFLSEARDCRGNVVVNRYTPEKGIGVDTERTH